MHATATPDDAALMPGSEDARARQMADEARQGIRTTLTEWLRTAWDARNLSGIEEEWQLAEDLYAGVEPQDSDMRPEHGGSSTRKSLQANRNRSKVVVNITAGKTDIAASQVIRRVLPGDMRPWEARPTPVPAYEAAVSGEDRGAMVTIADGSQHPVDKVAKGLLQLMEQKAEAASRQIEDWLTDPGLYRGKTAYAQLRKMIRDGARLGTGVIKGPIPAIKHGRKWDTSQGMAQLVQSTEILPAVACVSVRNCFPDPSCGDDIHQGTFFIERDYLTPRQLRDLAELPDYEVEEIAAILSQGPQGISRWDDRYSTRREGQTQVQDRSTFETFYVYGELSPAQLIAAGYRVAALTIAPDGIPEGDQARVIASQVKAAMELTAIPVVATMINGRVVRVTLNPSERGNFPYRYFRWQPVEGRPEGRGVPIQMSVPQRMLTSAVRATLENAGQSAGPQVVRMGCVNPVDSRLSVERNKHWVLDPTEGVDDVRKAFGLFNIPSVQQQLFAIIKASQEWADTLTNIPLLMQGIVGTAPDTVGGMEMLEANAASPLLDIAKEYDEVLGPLISDFYDWLMADPNVPDSAKGDLQCRALGATHLIHRDRKALALQQVVAPMSSDPGFGLSKQRVGEQILRHLEINPETVSLTQDEIQAQQSQQQPLDPRVEAAQIKRQSDAEREQSRRQSEAEERAHQAGLAKFKAAMDYEISQADLQIQVLESARDRDLSAEEIRATLAEAAMKIKDARERFVAERDFAIRYGKGRGL